MHLDRKLWRFALQARLRMCCSQSVGAIMLFRDVEAHKVTCDRRFEVCSICQAKVSLGGMDRHRTEAALEHSQILEKKVSEMEANQIDVAGRLARVELNMRFLARGSQLVNVARAQQKHLQISKKQRFAHLDTAVWTLGNVRTLLEKSPADSFVKSKKFSLKGVGGFRLAYGPNGDVSSAPGKASLWITGPCSLTWQVSLDVDGQVPVELSSMDPDEDNKVGRRDRWSKPYPGAKSVVITVKLLQLASEVESTSEGDSGDGSASSDGDGSDDSGNGSAAT